MSHHPTHAPRFPIFRRFSLRKHAGLWKPAAITGASGTAIAVWFDEIMMFGEEILALVFLPIMAGIIYLLDILIFKSRMPQRKDADNLNDRGAKK
jgi:hypothetical protein